ncbi:MAG TPA: hypothetical protein DDW52_15325 [Planctomycetaceae bacterium]|nr:hypothetical protein [Planctomycetaceae bacterium]
MARRPRFNDQESQLIKYAREGRIGGLTAFSLSYLTLGICVASFGIYYDLRLISGLGLLVLLFGRWQEFENDRTGGKTWREIVDKYEAAIDKYEDERE